MKKYLSVLQSCPLFEGIAPAEILSMLNCLSSQLKRFDKKEILLAEGDAVERDDITYLEPLPLFFPEK